VPPRYPQAEILVEFPASGEDSLLMHLPAAAGGDFRGRPRWRALGPWIRCSASL